MNDTPTVYAIDFGTTNSLLAAANRDRIFDPAPLDPFAPDPTLLRTILYFPDATKVFFGAEALREYAEHGMRGRLIRSIKKHLPSRAFVGTMIDERPMNLEDLIGVFLGRMRRRANEIFGADVDRVVLGRPAIFSSNDEDDRYAQYRLERAAKIAGFESIEFCPEPVAAAGSYAKEIERETLVLAVDLGGGTSDYTVMWMRPGGEGFSRSDVLATFGVSIAGDALDGAIMRRRIAKHFGAEVTYRVPGGTNVLEMPTRLRHQLCSPADLSLLTQRDAQTFLRNMQRWSLGGDDARRIEQLFVLVHDALGFALFEQIERAKRALSHDEEAHVNFVYPEGQGDIDVRERIARESFEEDAEREVDAILAALDRTLERAGVTAREIDLVCCTGGSARVPKIRRGLDARFGAEKIREMKSFHAVLGGLAARAHQVAREANSF